MCAYGHGQSDRHIDRRLSPHIHFASSMTHAKCNEYLVLQDFSHKCKQNADKSFAPLSYGRTLFIGESVRQREQLTARAFDICIIVEGDVLT